MGSKFLKYLFIIYFTFFSVSPTFASSISPLTVPTGGQVASGTININQSAPGKLVVNQTTNQGIINWQSFNVGVDAAVHFNTPNASAGTLNNISGGSSTILGSIYSNGRLFFANPSGIIFKPGSQVKAEGLVASAMKISNQDFLANNFNFTNNQIASLQNEGNLEAQYVALIAPQVLNKGTITTNVATIIAAGDDVKLAISDSNRLSVNINPAKIKTLSSNEGVIKSENGTVSIQANVAQELIDQTINTPKSADKLISENGVIKLVSNSGSIKSKNVNLSAGPLGGTEVSGTIDVSSNTKGGDIEITGKEINVKSNSTLLATGETGGGNILVGGDWQGSNGVLQATYTTVEKDTVIDASSKGIGDGGKIVVWSDIKDPNSKTVANGQLISKANIGEGGKIETSGSSLDTENISVDAGSGTGKGGLWLVDPYNYTINSDQASTITSSLNTGTNVSILTSSNNPEYGSSGNPNQNGDITIASNILTSSSSNKTSTLILNAARHIVTNSGVTIGNNGLHSLNLIFNAGGNIALNGEVNVKGTIGLTTNTYTSNFSATTINNNSTWTVPSGSSINSITVAAYGGAGANGETKSENRTKSHDYSNNGGVGGYGAIVTATKSVTSGENLYIYVGGGASNMTPGSGLLPGGYGGDSIRGGDGGGGGAATVISSSNIDSLTNALIIAGGGGGGGGASSGYANSHGRHGSSGGNTAPSVNSGISQNGSTVGYYTPDSVKRRDWHTFAPTYTTIYYAQGGGGGGGGGYIAGLSGSSGNGGHGGGGGSSFVKTGLTSATFSSGNFGNGKAIINYTGSERGNILINQLSAIGGLTVSTMGSLTNNSKIISPPVLTNNSQITQRNIEQASVVKIIPNGTNAVYGTNNNMTFNALAGPNFSPSPTSGPKNLGPAAGAPSGPQIISRFVKSATNINNVKNPVRLRQTNLGNKPIQIQPNNQPVQIQPNNQQNPAQGPIGSGLSDESL